MIGEISFCDQVGFNIKTDETKRYILDRLQQKYGLKIITKHFERYEERMLESFQKRPHLLCVRSNGNPYYLCLTRLNFVNYCIFIDKKIQQGYSYPRMIISHFRFEDKLFDDTILDGEMVKMNDGSWSFLLNDLVVLKGVHLTDHNIVKRINMLYDVLANAFVPDTNDISRIGVKRFFKYDEGLDIIHKHINEVQYSCRGIYFKPLFLKFRDILINFNDELVRKVERTKYKHMKSFMMHEDTNKLKDKDKDSDTMSVSSDASSKASSSSPQTNTIVHRNSNDTTVNTQRQYHTRKTNLPDVYEMFDNNMVSTGFASVPSLKISKFLRETFKNKNIVDSIILSYTYSEKHQKWVPVVV
jgi:hypothetical protein